MNHHMFEVRIFAEEFAMQFWITFFILHLFSLDFQKRLKTIRKEISKEKTYTPGSTNIAMGNPPFEDVFPIENGGFSIAMFVYQRV